jgi:4a-hydroxytetrahydrobiopterin dehydratase
MTELRQQSCSACRGDEPRLEGDELRELASQLDGWDVLEERQILKRWDFKDFGEALAFVNGVGSLAEAEGHHPQITFSYGWAKIELWTHKVDGLTRNDFILAAKIDAL